MGENLFVKMKEYLQDISLQEATRTLEKKLSKEQVGNEQSIKLCNYLLDNKDKWIFQEGNPFIIIPNYYGMRCNEHCNSIMKTMGLETKKGLINTKISLYRKWAGIQD